MITAHNFAPGNAGLIFYMDILPFFGFALLCLAKRYPAIDRHREQGRAKAGPRGFSAFYERKRPPEAGRVESQRLRVSGAFFVAPSAPCFSGEACPQVCCAEEVDGADDVVGHNAERRFAGDLFEASGEKSAACGHALDRSERMFGGASALSDQARVGLDAGVHPFERLLVQVTGDEAAFCRRAAWLQRAV
jgi:hypothetical protein